MANGLNPIPHTDKEAKKIVERFCAHVHWLMSLRHTFKVLFEDEQPSRQILMEKTASFFADLNRILLEYLLLECAKITDPATIRKSDNFTVDYLIKSIRWPDDEDGDILKELKLLQTITENFRRYIQAARNKLLAHLDATTLLSGESLGEFPEGTDKAFFEALQRTCNVAHEVCFGRIYGDMSPICPEGKDVIGLIQALERSVAFDVALSESSGQSEMWLYSCLQKARCGPKA